MCTLQTRSLSRAPLIHYFYYMTKNPTNIVKYSQTKKVTSMVSARRYIPPALALYLLSPVVGDLLSGSAPPAEFFTLFGFTIMVLLYGGGAVVCRELKVRWRKGMASLLLLGVAYAILEDGLMVASFQNPHWQDLGVLGVFGRWLGINWVWAIELSAYHSIVSITVPVMLVELAYPNRKGTPWLSGRWFKIILGLFLADVIIGIFLFSMFNGFWPPLPQYLSMIILTAVFVYVSHILPSDYARRGTRSMRKPRYYLVLTVLVSFSCGFIFWILPNNLEFIFAPVAVIILGLIVVLGYIRYLLSFDWTSAKPLHRFALAAGALVPLVIFSYIQEVDKSRVDDTRGMALVGTIFLIGLLAMYKRLRTPV